MSNAPIYYAFRYRSSSLYDYPFLREKRRFANTAVIFHQHVFTVGFDILCIYYISGTILDFSLVFSVSWRNFSAFIQRVSFGSIKLGVWHQYIISFRIMLLNISTTLRPSHDPKEQFHCVCLSLKWQFLHWGLVLSVLTFGLLNFFLLYEIDGYIRYQDLRPFRGGHVLISKWKCVALTYK